MFALVLCLVTALIFVTIHASAQGATHVDLLTVNGIIDPPVARYVQHGIDAAQQDGAECLVIALDTPGGHDTAMRQIVQSELNAPIPVVVYVSPSGARAASAGVLVTLAAHVAAMAPGTNIGAAHPVGLTGDITGTEGVKVTNDAAAYARSIAEQRGRNADWAEQAVRESVSITAQEAVDSHVADLTATSMTELLDRLDGTVITTAAGTRTLATQGAEVRTIAMSVPEQILHAISDPNVAYVLLIIGIIGVVAEFFHPGAILPGVTGAIALILAFVAFGSLPVNWGGLALIGLSVVLFIADIKVAGIGLSIGGAIAFLFGSFLLFTPLVPSAAGGPGVHVSPWLIGVMTIAITGFFVFALSAGIRARRARVITGPQALVGAIGVATTDLGPRGTVQVRSELWSAIAEEGEVIHAGDPVRVIAVEGLTLRVTREEDEEGV